MKIGTLRKLLVESKKLNHVLASSEAMGLPNPGEPSSEASEHGTVSGSHLELVISEGQKVVRFPNLHFHTLYIDGVYQLSADKKPNVFCPCAEPTLDELKIVLGKIIKKSISLLERRGFLVKDNEDPRYL